MALRKAECTVSVSAAMILRCPQESTEEAGEFGPPQQHHIIHPPTYVLPSRRSRRSYAHISNGTFNLNELAISSQDSGDIGID
ncbi:hypothetical protein E4U13_000165 [Claviceps humidiphila]|uniref:Uncharacterized protein n=1 Tax=Claviceps humidiphila TaxID=1294629 RepID=A0A9P7Q3Z5_9HYPO|nr:hypothetical protein E4U13_000165 [Claviceps humidiphila]